MELIVWLEESILGDLPKQSSAVSAVVPNRGFLDPWGSETTFSGVRNPIFEGQSLYAIVACTFFKITKIYEILQVLLLKRTLYSLVPTNVTYLTN